MRILLTCERSCDENGGEAANSSNKGRVADKPVVTANIMVVGVSTTIYGNS